MVTESGVGSPWKVLDYGVGEQSHMIIYVTYGKIRILSPVSSTISKPSVKSHSLCQPGISCALTLSGKSPYLCWEQSY